MTLGEKVKLYALLKNNKNIIELLAKAHEESEERRQWLEEQEQNDEYGNDDDDEDESMGNDVLEYDDQEELKVEDLPKIEQKMNYIDQLIKKNSESSGHLVEYFEKLQRDKNRIVEELNDVQKTEYEKNSGINLNELIKKEEIDRNK